MNTQQFERDQQTMGRYEVLMYGQEVVLFRPDLDSVRFLKPAEALILLEWLHQHQDDFRKAMHSEAAVGQGRWF